MIFLTKHYDWPQPAAEFRHSHSEYLLAWFTEQHMVNAVLLGGGCCSGYLIQTTTGHVYTSTSTCVYFSYLLMCVCGCAAKDIFSVCVSFTLQWLNFCHASVFHLRNGDCWDTLLFISDKWLILCLTGSQRTLLTFPHLHICVFFFTSFVRCEMCMTLESCPLLSFLGSHNVSLWRRRWGDQYPSDC